MTYVITKPCVGVKDTACVSVCPVDAIHPGVSEAAFATVDQLYIDPQTCIDCDLCVDECPVRALFRDEDVPSEFQSFIEKNAAFFRPQSKQ